MSLMTSLFVGTSGLTVSQNGLNTTAHNLSNLETKGYVRQQTLIQDYSYVTIGTSPTKSLQVGLGAATQAIRQVRNVFLDKTYRREVGRESFYEVQAEVCTEIEDAMGELDGVTYQDTLKGFWNSLQELAKEPDSIVSRATFVQTAVTFIERSDSVMDELKNYQMSLNTKVSNTVNRINEIADQIRELNIKIQKYEVGGVQNANDLRDSRNLLLDELGKYASITYKEDANGVVTVNVEGNMLVTEDNTYKLSVREIPGTQGLVEPYWEAFDTPLYNMTEDISMQTNTDVGYLKGLLKARGMVKANYSDIPVEPKREDFATTADYDAAMADFNTKLEYYNDYMASSILVSSIAQLDQLVHGIVTTINDIFCPNTTITAADGTVYKVWDEDNAPIGMDADNTQREALFNRKSTDRYTETVIDGKTYWVYNEEDPTDNYSLFTVGEIEVNPNILKDVSKLPLSLQGNTGDYAIDVAEKLLSAWQEPFATLGPESKTEKSFMDYYTEFIGNVGNYGEKMYSTASDQEVLVNDIDSQRSAVMATSADEELTFLIKFQHAYNASARYVNTVDEMLESLINSL